MVFTLYVDMDYFFAACEEVRHPELKGKPLVVGTAPANERTRGVVQTANYVARKYGIKSGMPNMDAFALCKEHLNYLQSDEPYYEEVSAGIMELFKSYKRPVEVISVDEAAMDITGLSNEEAVSLAKEIKSRIKEKFGLTCTIGICEGKTFAKMASDEAKPDGLMLVETNKIKDFIASSELSKIPGVGKKTLERLNEMRINTVEELAKADPMVLIDAFGSAGKELYMAVNGIDNSKIIENYETLSIGREITLKKASSDMDEIKPVLEKLAEDVHAELVKKNYRFKNVGAKVRYTDFTMSVRSYSLRNYTDSKEQMLEVGVKMIAQLLKNGPVRKVGIRVSKLIGTKGQKSLF